MVCLSYEEWLREQRNPPDAFSRYTERLTEEFLSKVQAVLDRMDANHLDQNEREE